MNAGVRTGVQDAFPFEVSNVALVQEPIILHDLTDMLTAVTMLMGAAFLP